MTLRQRQITIRDKAHLDFVRDQPCIACGKAPRNAAAHVRFSNAAAGTVNPGMQRKPCDSLTVPLCDPGCHKEAPGSQHSGNEEEFWQRHGIDPFAAAARLWVASGAAARHVGGPPPKKRKPRKPRATIRPKGFGQTQRPIPSRPFPRARKVRP